MGVLAGEFADCVAGQTGDVVFVTDREKIIAVSGCPAKGLVGENISRNMERILDDRDEKLPQSERSRFIPVKEGMEETGQTWCLIRSEGEVVGMVILQNKDKKKKIGEMEKKIVSVAADFLGKQVSV
ncbi:MAG: hypothetical protein MR867_01880 [Eubacterium sp.]|nr:hypothetical protein [Eubacterium sp.]